MPLRPILALAIIHLSVNAAAQDVYKQYFDGADTLEWNSLSIEVVDDSTNIWQIGTPQKPLFNQAATVPNAIVTDTINFYPTNDSSSFSFEIPQQLIEYGWGVFALQWMQKLDYDEGDGGVVEFSTDFGETWSNAMTDPVVYNYYGYNEENIDTLFNGEIGFTGQDTLWKNIWLCFDESWLYYNNENLRFRFTSFSDSITGGVVGQNEGWMMDNFIAALTIIHTVQETEIPEYLNVSPNPTKGPIQIEARKVQGFHIIEEMELINSSGHVVQTFGASPTKYQINISHHPPGIYFLKVKTNLATETMRVVLN